MDPIVSLTELQPDDLSFLIQLWHDPEVMRYADELPHLRGWSKTDAPQTAWEAYQARCASLETYYVQLIVRLPDRTPIGESFFAELGAGATFGKWRKPEATRCMLGDIKLAPEYWGRGLGSSGMHQVVRYLFAHTACGLLVVPPHRKNPAAERVYEKAGFVLFKATRSYRGHRVMELTRSRYLEIYSEVTSP